MVFFGSLRLLQFFPIERGVDPVDPPKIPFRGTCYIVFPGGVCLVVFGWLGFFPKILGLTHQAMRQASMPWRCQIVWWHQAPRWDDGGGFGGG